MLAGGRVGLRGRLQHRCVCVCQIQKVLEGQRGPVILTHTQMNVLLFGFALFDVFFREPDNSLSKQRSCLVFPEALAEGSGWISKKQHHPSPKQVVQRPFSLSLAY